MGQYVVTGPNGKKYKVNAPEGASEEEIISYAQSQLAPAEAPAEEEDEGGFFQGFGNAIVRMGGRARGLFDAYQAEQFAAIADGEEQLRREAAEREATGVDNRSFFEKLYLPNSSIAPESVEDLRGLAAQNIVEQDARNRAIAEQYPIVGGGADALSDVIEAGEEGGLKGLKAGFQEVLDQPLDVLSGVAQVGVEQAPTLAAAIAATIKTRNPRAGMAVMGGSTYAQERFGQMAETAQKYGYDLSNPEQAKRAVENPEFMAEQKDRGITRGMVIATIDAVTLGLGSKLPSNVKGLAGNTALQIAGGGTGEAAAQIATDGEVTSSGEVIIEGLAEGVTAPIDATMLAIGKKNESATDLETELANEAAKLDAAAEVEETQQNEVELTLQDRRRREAAKGFMTDDEFIAQKTAELNERNELDIDNPETAIGQAFEAFLNGGNPKGEKIFSEDKVAAARTKFLKDAAKNGIDKTALAVEYEAALDQRAAELEAQQTANNPQLSLNLDNPNALVAPGQLELNLPEVAGNVDAKVDQAAPAAPTVAEKGDAPVVNTEAGPAPEVMDTAPKKPEAKARAAMRRYAEEKLGKNWEVEHPDLQMRFVDGKGFHNASKKTGLTGFQNQVNKTLTEQQADEAPSVDTTSAAPEAESTSLAVEAENTVTPAGFTPSSQLEENAVAYAERELGSAWTETYPELVNTLTDKKYGLFQREVDAAAEKTDNVSEARRGVDFASKIIAESDEFKATLSPNEAKVFDTLLTALRSNDADTVIQEDGATNATDVAAKAGVSSKQIVTTSLKRIAPKIAKHFNMTVPQVKEELKKTSQGSTEAAAELDAPVSVLDKSQLPGGENNTGSMGTVSSAGASQSKGASSKAAVAARKAETARFKKLGMTDEQITEFYERSDAPQADPIVEGRAEALRQDTLAKEQAALTEFEAELRNEWSDRSSNDAPSFDQLSEAQKIDWMRSVSEYNETNDDAQLDEDQRELERLAPAKEATNENVTGNKAEAARQIPEGNNSNAQSADGSGTEVNRTGATPSGVIGRDSGGSGGPVNSRGEPIKVVTKPRGGKKLTNKPSKTGPKKFSLRSKMSRADTAVEFDSAPKAAPAPSSVKKIEAVANKLFDTENMGYTEDGQVFRINANSPYSPIQIHATVKDAFRALRGSMTRDELANAQGFVDPRDGSKTHFIAENIRAGEEAGVILHEVGVHVGLENLMSNEQVSELSATVDDWASASETSIERKIYDAVVGRMAFARATGMHESLVSIEKIAYAVEEAVNLGVEVTSESKSRAAKWLNDAKKLFRNLATRFFYKQTGQRDDVVLSAEELVALVHGAARGVAEQMQVETAAITGDEDVVMAYYAGQDLGRSVADDAELIIEDGDRGGEESFIWGEDTTVGEFKDIATLAEFDSGGSMSMDVIGVKADGGPREQILTLELDRIETGQEGLPFVYSLAIYGPNVKDASTNVKDVDGDSWSRLENVRGRELVRLLAEGRRRVTRFTGGAIPNIVWDRVTGAVVNNKTGEARRGGASEIDLYKKFSLKKDSKGEISVRQRKGRDFVKRNMGQTSAQAYDALAGVATAPGDYLVFLYDLVARAEKKMPSVRAAYNAMKKQEATKNEMLIEYERVANRAGQLAPERYALLNDFVGKSTFFQKWGYDPTTTHPELFKGRTVKVDPIMKVAWGRLTKQEKSIAADMFAQGEKNRKRMREFMEKLGLKGNLFGAISKLEGPYAPLKRFGNHVAVLKSKKIVDMERQLANSQGNAKLAKEIEALKSQPDQYVVQFFDTEGAAKTFAEQNSIDNKGKFFRVEAFKRDSKFDSSRAPSSDALEQLMGKLNADEQSGLDDDSKEAFRKMLREQYYSMMDERDARLSGARRLNRAGYDKDMVRSFLFHGSAQAQMISTMEEAGSVHGALAQMKREAAADRGNLQETYNLVSEHYSSQLAPQDGMFNAIQDRVATFNTVHMLTTNIGYHVQNFTQVLIGINKLTGDFNSYTQSWKYMFKGLKTANNAIKGGGFFRQLSTVATAGLIDVKNNIEIDNTDASMPREYQELVRTLEQYGIADVGIQEDMRQFNRFDTGFGPLNALTDKFAGMVHRNFQVARYVEVHNRLGTAIAAFEMAKRNPRILKNYNMTSPIEYAVSAVQRTQGAFNGLDAPLAFKKMPKLTLQYRKYQVMMVWNYIRAAQQAYENETPGDRAMGLRTLGVTLAHAGITSGIRGLPWAGPIVALSMMRFGDEEDDIPDEAKAAGGYDEWLEQYIRDNVEDERVADLLTRGVPAFFGIDMSSKIGHQNLFAFQPYSDLEITREGVPSYIFDVVAGPTASTIRQGIKGYEKFKSGDYMQMVEAALPKGQRQMLESYRLSTEGMTFKNGEEMLDPRSIDMTSLLVNALGIPSNEISKLRWTRGQQFELKKYFTERTGELNDAYHRAYRKKDREKMNSLKDEWRELQKAKRRVRPFFNGEPSALKPAPLSNLMRLPMQRRRQASRNRRQLGTD